MRHGKKASSKNSLDIAFDSAIDFELDFDLDDFDLTLGEENEDEGGFKTRIMRPKMNVKNVSHKVVYRNAEKLAEKIDLTEGARTFAWVSGDFIFGDLLEALVMKKRISPKKYIFVRWECRKTISTVCGTSSSGRTWSS